MRKRIYTHIIVLLVTLITSLDVNQWIYAKEETIVPSAIRYSEDNKEAEILFNVEGVDEEEYELISIVSDSNSVVVYDGTQDTSEDIAYTIDKNGDYSFTITYIENQEEEIEEKTTVLIASVTEIITTEKTETNEENKMDEETDIDEEVTEELLIATLSDSDATQADTGTDTITFNADTFPDKTLREWITDTFGFQEDDVLTVFQIEQVVKDELEDTKTGRIRAVISSSSSYTGIENIKGLEYFSNIQEISLSYTQVTSISYEHLPESLEALTINATSSLTSIDVSRCSNLNTLTASNNKKLSELTLPESIETLTLSNSGLSGDWKFSDYTSLNFLSTSGTNITSLDLSGCSSLVTLYANNNRSLISLKLPTEPTLLATLYLYMTGLSGEWDFSDYIYLRTLSIFDTNITGIDVSGCTSLTSLNVTSNPLAYLRLPSSLSSGVSAGSLISRDVGELKAEVDEDGIYIFFNDLFKEIQYIDMSKISEVSVTNGKYDYDTGRLYEIGEGTTTISYKYDTDNSNYSITASIEVLVDISDLLPDVEGLDDDFGVTDSITKSDLLRYGTAKTYDDTEGSYSLLEIEQHGMKITVHDYYYFDYSTENWKPIGLEELLNFTCGTGIYAYQFTVQDNRDSRLTSKGVSRFFVGGEASYIERNDDKSYVLIYNIGSLSIKETMIVAMYSDKEKFTKYLESQFSCQGYQDNGELNIKKASTVYDYSSFNLDISSPTELTPGNYELSVTVGENINDSSQSLVKKIFSVEITENPYSYEEDGDSIDNGASGYIIIPKSVELEKNEILNTLTGEAEVKFANYPNATGVNYEVSVDKEFVIKNNKDESNQVTVTVSSTDADAITEDSSNILNLGTFSTSNIDSGKKITFSTDPITEVNDSKWEGSFIFYFTRK